MLRYLAPCFYTFNYLYEVILDLPYHAQAPEVPQFDPEPHGEVGDHDFLILHPQKHNNVYEVGTLFRLL